VQERVVLCGDAAHQFPPTGGLGVNTGLQGMHNAMWKLAMCMRDHAAWGLLDTYDAERRIPSRQTTEQSLENHRNVGLVAAAAFDPEGQSISAAEVIRTARRYGNHLGVEFGTAYASTAVIPDGSTPPEVADSYSDYEPSGVPGCRAPHVWLADDGLSTLDLFGPHFTVLAGPDGAAWSTAARSVSATVPTTVVGYAIGAPGLRENTARFLDVYGIEPGGAVLVRPDGYVAWRSRAAVGADPGTELEGALQRILRGDRPVDARRGSSTGTRPGGRPARPPRESEERDG
jgi:hypothetical protein